MLRLVRLFPLVVPFLLAAPMVEPAAAQTTPPSLTGETLGTECTSFPPSFACFSQGAGKVTTTCQVQPDGTAIINFSAVGIAIGPYPGTFSESGTYTLGPLGSGGGGVGSVVTGFSAKFSIQSPVGTVSGTKTAVAAEQSQISNNFCIPPTPPGPLFGGAFAHYVATILTAQGTFSDSGTAVAQLNGASAPRPVSGFFENFASTTGVVPISCNQEETGQHDPGCQFGPNK